MKKNGFTLIEVLIALMIIAIAMSAVIRSMNQSIRVTDRVKMAMASHWVAMNALSEIQLGMIKPPVDGSPIRGSAKMLGLTWPWSAALIDDNQSYVSKVRIRVYKDGQSIDSLSGYVG